MLVIFALHFKLPIINLLDKALKIRDVNFKIVHFVISNNIDLSGLNKIARFLFQVNDILNIRHVGYNLFEVCYE